MLNVLSQSVVVQNVLLAAFYWLFGYAGMSLATPDGLATIFWPSSGLALAFTYLYGYRVLPGVFIGCFVLNFTGYADFSDLQVFKSSLNAFGNAFGASLQAFLGGWLVRTYVGRNNRLENLYDILKFSFLSGPVSCLVSASVGVSFLVLSGSIIDSAIPFIWSTWYVGDTLGVLVFGPALILFLQSSGVSARRKLMVGLPLLFIFALIIGLFALVRSWDFQKEVERFESVTDVIFEEIKLQIDAYMFELDVVDGLFQASNVVDEDGFEAFTESAFERHPSIFALLWLPHNQHDRAEDLHSVQRYFYHAPKLNTLNLGHDFLSREDLKPAIKYAHNYNVRAATSQLELFLDDEGLMPRKVFWVFNPVFKYKDQHQHSSRHDALIGVVAGIFEYQGMLASVLDLWASSGIGLQLFQVDELGQSVFLFDTLNPQAAKPAAHTIDRTMEIEVANQTWVLDFYEDPEYLLSHVNWSVWVALAVGLGLAFMSSVFLLSLTGQTAVVEGMVNEKTKELQEINNFSSLVMDNVPDMVFVKDKDFKIVSGNKAFLDMYSDDDRDGVIGTTGLEQFPQHEREMYLVEDKKALGDGYSEVHEENTIYDGTTRTLLTRKVGFKNEAGEPFVLGVARDVTDMLMAQNKLQAVLDTTADGLITIRENGVVETYNKACETIFGYTPEEVIGQNVSMLMPKRYAQDHGAYIHNFTQTGKAKIIGKGRELEALHKNGQEFPVYLGVSEVKVGSRRFFSGIVRDITQQKEVETELRRSNKELQDFAYVASHDLKAPLRHVSLSAGFLKDRYKDSFDEQGVKFLDTMMQSTARMQNMIESLLSYSRVGRKGKDSFGPIFLQNVLINVQSTMASVISEKGAVIEAQNLPQVLGDQDLLEQLFQNLIQNSIKYAKDGVPARIQIQARRFAGHWEISFADNGIGIAPEYQDKVFQIFQRLHRDGEYEGVGIGLSICQRIVEFHGGSIWIDAGYSGGAKFVFILECP